MLSGRNRNHKEGNTNQRDRQTLVAFLGGVLSLLAPCSALLLPMFFAYTIARTHVWSPVAQEVLVRIRRDDGVRVLLGGKEILEFQEAGYIYDDPLVKPGRLAKGWNLLEVQIENQTSEWGFQVAIVAPEGHPIPELRFAATPE